MGHRKTPRKTIAYISCAQTKEIIIFELLIEEEQALQINQASVTGPNGPSVTSMPIAVHPTRKFLYAAVRRAPYPVSSYAIDPSDGRLSVLSTTPLPDNMAYIRTDLSGRYLLSASYSGANFCLNLINESGNVLSPEIQQLATPPKTHSVIPNSSNRFLYVASLAGDVILQYEFDSTGGAVTPTPVSIAAAPAGAGPRHLILHPNGVYLYVINELGGTITAFHLEARSGIPTAIQTATI
jgi:6-phosphogluconolactonase